MTEKELQKALGTLVLYRDGAGGLDWKKARLVHVFDLPDGFAEDYRCCLVKRPEESKIIYQRQIYYAFPHFNKKIRVYNEQSTLENYKKYASATKQHAAVKLNGRRSRIY